MRLWNAGHLLGSASVEIEAEADGETTRLLFSGDIGPDGKLLQDDPEGPGRTRSCDLRVDLRRHGTPPAFGQDPPRDAARGSARRGKEGGRADHSLLRRRAHAGIDDRSRLAHHRGRSAGLSDLHRLAPRRQGDRRLRRARGRTGARTRTHQRAAVSFGSLHAIGGAEQGDRALPRLSRHHLRERHVRGRAHSPSPEAMALARRSHRALRRLSGAGHARAHPPGRRAARAHHGRGDRRARQHPPARHLFRPRGRAGARALDRRTRADLRQRLPRSWRRTGDGGVEGEDRAGSARRVRHRAGAR